MGRIRGAGTKSMTDSLKAKSDLKVPAQAILSGTAIDDGLPNNTLTTTWTVVSGRGGITFDDANQSATAATLSVPGTYVLQLSASDGVLTV